MGNRHTLLDVEKGRNATLATGDHQESQQKFVTLSAEDQARLCTISSDGCKDGSYRATFCSMLIDQMKIFISHSKADQELAEALIELLQLGAAVPHSDIFYSKDDIPNGSYFVQTILSALGGADMILSILSRSYFESEFCLAEAGGGLMRRVAGTGRFYSLVVPPVTFGELGGALYGMQSGRILASKSLSELRDVVIQGITNPPGTSTWNERQAEFLKKAAEIIARKEDLDLLTRIVLEDVSPIQRDNTPTIIFKTKVRIILKNDTGKDLEIGPITWDQTGDMVPLQAPISPMKLRLKGANEPEVHVLPVPAGRSLSTWIGVASHVTDEEVLRRCATRKLGGMKFAVAIGGQKVDREIRL